MNYDESGTPLVKSRCQLQVVILSLGSGLFVVVFHFLSLVAALFPFLSFFFHLLSFSVPRLVFRSLYEDMP